MYTYLFFIIYFVIIFFYSVTLLREFLLGVLQPTFSNSNSIDETKKNTIFQQDVLRSEVKNFWYLQNTEAQNQLWSAVKTTLLGGLKRITSIYNQFTLQGPFTLEVPTYWKTPPNSLLSLIRGGLVNGKKIYLLFLKLGANNHFFYYMLYGQMVK